MKIHPPAPPSEDGALVLDESSRIVTEEVCGVPAQQQRAAGWRRANAFEVHAALRQLHAASHIIDVCVGRLLRLLNGAGPGFWRWGCTNFKQYVTQDLRQPSARGSASPCLRRAR